MLTTIKKYEDVQEKINRIFRSGLQIKIILSLGEGSKNLSNLRTITGSSSQAILPVIRKLEAEHLILSLRTEYSLTPSGKIVFSKIYDCIHTFDILKNQQDFLRDHFLEGIPSVFLEKLGDLRNCKIITDTNVEIFQAYAHFLNNVKNAKRIYRVTSMMSPGHADAMITRVLEGIPVELLVSSDVAEQLKNEPYGEKIRNLDAYENFSIFAVSQPMKLGLLITDSCLSLGLFKKDGMTYDPYTDLVSNEKSAISWGHEIFQYYKDQSEPVFFE